MNRLWRSIVWLALAVPALPAGAQMRLPMHAAGAGLGLGIDRAQQTLDEHGFGSLDPLEQGPAQRLLARGQERVRRMIREHRDVLEADPQGDAVVRNEVLASFTGPEAMARALALGFTVRRERDVAGLGIRVLVLEAPAHWSLSKALRELRKSAPDGTYDYNHVFLRSGTPGAPAILPGRSDGAMQKAADGRSAGRKLLRVGLVDTGVDTADAVFARSVVHPWGCQGTPHPGHHGTAVASLLVAGGPAELYAADVYCGEPAGGAVDAVLGAFAWLASEHVPVINVSLVGPKNLLLAEVVAALVTRGYVIVAAVGNDGPAAPPLYPAAYPHVVGVTAVDAHRRVLLEAEHGPQVTFAALGADVTAADLHDGTSRVRGTSFAAPVVAARFAARLDAPDPAAAAAALRALIAEAVDLGPRGWDPIYGYGLLSAP